MNVKNVNFDILEIRAVLRWQQPTYILAALRLAISLLERLKLNSVFLTKFIQPEIIQQLRHCLYL